MRQARAEGSVRITRAAGLHARPSVRLTKLAKSFEADIMIGTEGDDAGWVDAKSIVKVMALKIGAGETLVMRAEGSDADAAIAALTELVERDFDESGLEG